ncbi:MAG: SusC/RagA family TonB-linked outer membrane protein [Dysgonamonadaceae bacterium]|jgi:TonB-linked SusC/RagA family outer membrane protein|nr:SusC/RagA family TonB-linked outer membrane protein [Dysgonamonadaceae bacterium]
MKQINKNKKYLLLGFIMLAAGTGIAAAQETVTADTVTKKAVAVDRLDTPYGAVAKESYLGAAATVYTDKLTQILSPTILPALVGRLPGLYIGQNRGAIQHQTSASATLDLAGWLPVFGAGNYSDNSQFNINLRGNSPVVLVDGVERELFLLDPEAIESVSVQKDALSSLMMGMKSSRGLMVITTKKTQATGMQLSFTARYGIEQPLNIPKPLSAYQYAYLLNEALQNDGKSPAYTFADFDAYRNHTSPVTHPDINWYNEIFKKQSATQSYALSASGGGDIAQYYISLGYMNQEGLFRTSSDNPYNTNQDYSRYLITSRLNVNVTKDFKAELSLIGRIEDGNQPGIGVSSLLNTLYNTPNNAYPVLNPNGSFAGTVSFQNNLWAQTIRSGYRSDNARDAVANLTLNYDMGKLIKGLSAKATGSVSSQSRSALDRSRQVSVFHYKLGKDGLTPAYESFGTTRSQSNSFTPVSNYQYMYGQIGLDYERAFGVHGFGAGVFADVKQITSNYNLPDKPVNFYGNIKYDYAKKYFAEAAIDRSYYNGYAPGKQWGTFYAFGLGWMLSRESFLANIDWLSQWKIRSTFGETGSGIDNTGYYTWRQSYTENHIAFYPHGTSRTSVDVVYEVDNFLANPNLTYEKARKFNFGTDISLLSNRLSFTADYFHDYYYDMFTTRGKSTELIGMLYPAENIAIVSANGMELSIGYQDRIGNFKYSVAANWTQQNSIIDFMDEQEIRDKEGKLIENFRRTGKSSGAIFGLKTDGFFSSREEINQSPIVDGYNRKNLVPGDVKYVDSNNDGVIDQYDQTVIGGDKPLCYFGLDLNLEYRGWELSALIQGVYNIDYYYADATYNAGFQGVNQGFGQAYENMLNRWTPETAATATLPRLTAGGNSYNLNPAYLYTDMWVRSGNYIRLKNITLAYTLPEKFAKACLGGLKVKLFVAGQNLLTKAACSEFDPEVVDFRNYPQTRGFNMGINVKF